MTVSIQNKPVASRDKFEPQVVGRVNLLRQVLVNSYGEEGFTCVLLCIFVQSIVEKLHSARILKDNLEFRS